jgi:hypothetical protein
MSSSYPNAQFFSGEVVVTSDLDVGTGKLYVDTSTSKVGINTTTPQAALDVVGDARVSGELNVGTGKLFVDVSTNNVGIGTTTPQAALDVVGGVRVDTDTFVVDHGNDRVGINTTTPQAALDVVGGVRVDTDTFVVDDINDRVGINTTTPQAALDVVGDTKVSGDLNVNAGKLFVDVSTSKVGINTTTPQATLDVVGDTKVSGDLNVNAGKLFVDVSTSKVGINTTTPQAALDVVGDTKVSGDLNVNAGKLFVDVSTSKVGINTTTPQATLDVVGDTKVSGDLNVGDANLFVDVSTSKVGINTTTPQATLDVVGDTKVSGDLNVNAGKLFVDVSTSNVGINTATPQATLDVQGDLIVGDGNLFVDVSTSNVGIGTTTPQATLDVRGDLRVGDGNLFVDVSTSNVGIGTTTPQATLDVVGGVRVDTDTFVVDHGNDRVGINTDTPQADLDVVGDARVSGELNVGTGKLFVDVSTNNVGIGTTQPLFTLDVQGDINFTGNLNQDGTEFISTPWTINTSPDFLTYASNVGIGTTQPQATLDIRGSILLNNTNFTSKTSNITTQYSNIIENISTSISSFGLSGSIYDNIIVTGSNRSDSYYNGTSDTGSIGIFYNILKSPQNWLLNFNLSPTDLSTGDRFGTSVDIYEDTIAVSAPLQNSGDGAVYIYERNIPGDIFSTWTMVHKILGASNSGDNFGKRISLYKDNIISNGNTDGIYLYSRGTSNNWIYRKVININSFSVIYDIDLYENTFAVSYKIDNTTRYHVVDIYTFDQSYNITKRSTLTQNSNSDYFGQSLKLSEDYIIIGCPLDDISNTGAAYIYMREIPGDITSSWILYKKLLPPSILNTYFGGTVSVENNRFIIGDPIYDSGKGSIHVYYKDDISYYKTLTVTTNPLSTDRLSSNFIDISNNIIISGSENTKIYNFQVYKNVDLEIKESNDNVNLKLDGDITLNGYITSTQSIWVAPTLLNNWENFSSGNNPTPVGYYKDALNRVHIRGEIQPINSSTGQVIFNLNLGFRPQYDHICHAISDDGAQSIIIKTNGDVEGLYSGYTPYYLSINGISFLAA